MKKKKKVTLFLEKLLHMHDTKLKCVNVMKEKNAFQDTLNRLTQERIPETVVFLGKVGRVC